MKEYKIHSDDYDYGQYRLWARLIKNNQWKDFNNPPNLPMITGKVLRKEKGGNAVTVYAKTALIGSGMQFEQLYSSIWATAWWNNACTKIFERENKVTPPVDTKRLPRISEYKTYTTINSAHKTNPRSSQ